MECVTRGDAHHKRKGRVRLESVGTLGVEQLWECSESAPDENPLANKGIQHPDDLQPGWVRRHADRSPRCSKKPWAHKPSRRTSRLRASGACRSLLRS